MANISDIVDRISTAIKLRVRDRLLARYERSRLRRKDFSIICNDCVGWGIYHKFGLQYTTPTVGLFFYSEDYITFLEGFEHFIKQPIRFKDTSRHSEANEIRKQIAYPIGVLDEDVEVHFLHYKDEIEAAEKWARRTSRINLDNLFFIYSDGEHFREEFLDRYQKLSFKNKIFLSSKPRKDYSCVIFIRDYVNSPSVGDSIRNRKYEKYLNLTKWLNGEPDFLKK